MAPFHDILIHQHENLMEQTESLEYASLLKVSSVQYRQNRMRTYLFVREGQAEGSIAFNINLSLLIIESPRNGSAIPLKLLPPPVHPTIISGLASNFSNCFCASKPMIVWCIAHDLKQSQEHT